MRVYLDTSVLKRPFDDQSQARIRLETEAAVTILAMVQAGQLTLVTSSILRYEHSRNPNAERRSYVERVLRLCQIGQVITGELQQRAASLEALGLGAVDARHAASAEFAQADYLVTCDARLRRRYPGPLRSLNPAALVLELTQPT